jgi:hypothetical protein
LFVVLLVMAPSSQELEPPANPGRFKPRQRNTHSSVSARLRFIDQSVRSRLQAVNRLPATPLAPSVAHQARSGLAVKFRQNPRRDCQGLRVLRSESSDASIRPNRRHQPRIVAPRKARLASCQRSASWAARITGPISQRKCPTDSNFKQDHGGISGFIR